MKKFVIKRNKPMLIRVVLSAVFFLFSCIRISEVNAAMINAASCEYADVQAAVDSASAGDTIIVPNGSCTWSSTLTITKGINLVGAGIGVTTINGNNRGLSECCGLPIPMISYNPSSDSQIFRITGFTFNITNQGCIRMRPNSEPTTQTDIRIHHNRFTNVPATSGYGGCVLFNWGCFGVFDNNIVDDVPYPFRVGNSRTSSGQDAWASYSDDWGTVNNIYVEDNTISTHGNGGIMTDGDQGGRYAFRYNTITIADNTWPLFDAHGGRGTLYGTMQEEIYGNTINCGGYQIFLVSHRGGRGTAHHNNIINSDDPVVNIYNNTGCPPTPYYDRQLINNSYFFQNRENTTGSFIPDYTGSNTCGDVVEDSTFWMDNPSCIYPSTCSNITTGIGCGPLANRPTSCTEGVGYWATDQSCTDLTGMTGANPSTPISGTLYKCTSTDTWTAWYTPFTYPHPLRTNDAAYEYIINVYPNPCRVYQGENTITFIGDLSIGDNIKVFDMSGKLVHDSGALSEATYQWGVGDITSGILFFVVKSADGKTKASGKIAIIR